jgi:hypothetical protein
LMLSIKMMVEDVSLFFFSFWCLNSHLFIQWFIWITLTFNL